MGGALQPAVLCGMLADAAQSCRRAVLCCACYTDGMAREQRVGGALRSALARLLPARLQVHRKCCSFELSLIAIRVKPSSHLARACRLASQPVGPPLSPVTWRLSDQMELFIIAQTLQAHVELPANLAVEFKFVQQVPNRCAAVVLLPVLVAAWTALLESLLCGMQ